MGYSEGFFDNGFGRSFFCIHGSLGRGLPLLVLHGGPGTPHNYLEELSGLSSERAVVFYDQLGCGLSTSSLSPEELTVSLFLEELEALRSHLGIERADILGHSWGAALACEYSLAHPSRVRRLVLSGPLFDSYLWQQGADSLRDLLPEGEVREMRMLESQGQAGSDRYQELYRQLILDHFAPRLERIPAYLSQAREVDEIYRAMWGCSEFQVTGSLSGYSLLGRLGGVEAPALVISGRRDLASPPQVEAGVKELKQARWCLVDSSHWPHLEDPKGYKALVDRFLS